MTLRKELKRFDDGCTQLGSHIAGLSKIEKPDADDEFLAEAIGFRLFRIQERLLRSCFLDCCVKTQSISKKPIRSKLRCKDWETAEEIIKAGNRFLDWGNPTSTRNLSDLVFKDGYPVSEILLMKQSTLIDLQRIRNFIAHDSKEAEGGFKKTCQNYVRTGDAWPDSAGALLLYRKRASAPMTLRVIFDQVSQLSEMVRNV